MISISTHDASIKLEKDDFYLNYLGPKGPISTFIDNHILVLSVNGNAYYIDYLSGAIKLKEKKIWLNEIESSGDSALVGWSIIEK